MPQTEQTIEVLTQPEDAAPAQANESLRIPDGKVLVQSFANVFGSSKYANALKEIIGESRYIDAGSGIDTISSNNVQVGLFDKNDQGGGKRPANAFQRAINNSAVDTNKLPAPGMNASDGIKQIAITNQQLLWIQNFITGNSEKFDELVNTLQSTLTRYEYLLANLELKRIYNAIQAKTPFDPNASGNAGLAPTSNNIVCATPSQSMIDALTNIMFIEESTESDNSVFAIGADGTTGTSLPENYKTNCEDIKKWKKYINPYLKSLMLNNLHNYTIRNPETFKAFIETFSTQPLNMENPERNVIQYTSADGATIVNLQWKVKEDATNPDINTFSFKTINTATGETTDLPSGVSIDFATDWNELGTSLVQTGTATGFPAAGTYKFQYVKSNIVTQFVPMNTIFAVYQNENHDGVYSMYNLKIENTMEWVKSLSKDKYINIRTNVVSANTTRVYIYKDDGLSTIQPIIKNS